MHSLVPGPARSLYQASCSEGDIPEVDNAAGRIPLSVLPVPSAFPSSPLRKSPAAEASLSQQMITVLFLFLCAFGKGREVRVPEIVYWVDDDESRKLRRERQTL